MTVLIDLGEIRGDGEGDREPVPGSRTPGRSRPVLPGRHRILGVLLAVAATAVGVAPAPLPPLLVEVSVAAQAGDFLAVHDDRMYVISPKARQPGVPDRTIAAYRLPDGDQLWRVALPVTAQVPCWSGQAAPSRH